jgi:DNA-binding XRE family transcriptional regulator
MREAMHSTIPIPGKVAMGKNNVRTLRESQLMSKAELARKAGVSPLTIDRIEKGENCRMDTKRKIILALGLGLGDKLKVFSNDDDNGHRGLAKGKARVRTS